MSETAPPRRYVRPVEVRFRDIDAMGVGHHTLPLVYFEEARAAWWREALGREGLEGIDYILAEVQLRYHAPVRWPATLQVSLAVSRIGRRSFELEYEARSATGELLVSGRTVQVMFDYAAGAAMPIPDATLAVLEAFAGPSLSSRAEGALRQEPRDLARPSAHGPSTQDSSAALRSGRDDRGGGGPDDPGR